MKDDNRPPDAQPAQHSQGPSLLQDTLRRIDDLNSKLEKMSSEGTPEASDSAPGIDEAAKFLKKLSGGDSTVIERSTTAALNALHAFATNESGKKASDAGAAMPIIALAEAAAVVSSARAEEEARLAKEDAEFERVLAAERARREALPAAQARLARDRKRFEKQQQVFELRAVKERERLLTEKEKFARERASFEKERACQQAEMAELKLEHALETARMQTEMEIEKAIIERETANVKRRSRALDEQEAKARQMEKDALDAYRAATEKLLAGDRAADGGRSGRGRGRTPTKSCPQREVGQSPPVAKCDMREEADDPLGDFEQIEELSGDTEPPVKPKRQRRRPRASSPLNPTSGAIVVGKGTPARKSEADILLESLKYAPWTASSEAKTAARREGEVEKGATEKRRKRGNVRAIEWPGGGSGSGKKKKRK